MRTRTLRRRVAQLEAQRTAQNAKRSSLGIIEKIERLKYIVHELRRMPAPSPTTQSAPPRDEFAPERIRALRQHVARIQLQSEITE
jgi:hypothetical protein